ncbi:LOW QUALITY PROTEIN: tubulin-folding cofactor B [Cariama cristata]
MKAAAEPGVGPGLVPVLGAGSVSLAVSSSLNSFRAHKRYSTGLTIAEFKCKLELVVGSPASCMDLELYSTEEELLGRLDCDEALLGSYPVADASRVHVIDRSGARIGEYEDFSQVEKYRDGRSDYENRQVTTIPLQATFPSPGMSPLSNPCGPSCGSDAGDAMTRRGPQRRAAEQQQRQAQEAALAATLPLGARCQVQVPGQPCKRATIMYVGQTDFKPGYWVGVRYDEPLGKHDGSVGGRRYFECQPKYGAFVKPQSVTPGDFPEEDDGLEASCEGDTGAHPSAGFTPKSLPRGPLDSPARVPAGRCPSGGGGAPRPVSVGVGVARCVLQPMGGRAEEDAGPRRRCRKERPGG